MPNIMNLDLAKKINYTNILMEAVVSMDKIVHMDEMKTDDFIRFVKSFVDIENRKVEISEKIDGQNFSFGFEANKFFTKTKKSKPVYDSAFYGDIEFMQGFKIYHKVLASAEQDLRSFKEEVSGVLNIPGLDSIQIFGELLPSAQTNALKYENDKIGEGAIVLFDIKVGGKTILKNPKAMDLFDKLTKKLDKQGGWRVYNKPLIDDSQFSFDVIHLTTLENIYIKYYDVINSRKKADKPLKTKAKQVIQSLIDNIKVQMLKRMIDNRKSILGNIKPEGLIIRDFSNGFLVKLVDKDGFSKLNQENHGVSNDIQMAVRKLRTKIKNDIFGNADILKNFAKVIEKATDSYFVKKQIDPNYKLNSLDQVLIVAYEDMVEEKRIKMKAPQACNYVIKEVKELIKTLGKIEDEWKTKDKKDLPDTVISVTDTLLTSTFTDAKDILRDLQALKSSNNGIKIYLSIMTFISGRKKINELISHFNLTEKVLHSFDTQLLKETDTGLWGKGVVDDGPSFVYDNLVSYKNRINNWKSLKGMEVINMIIKGAENHDYSKEPYNKPVDSVSFFPAGFVGDGNNNSQGIVSHNRTNASEHSALAMWVDYVTKNNEKLGMKIININDIKV